MHHPTDRIAHTTAFVTPVVEHWLEQEIAKFCSVLLQLVTQITDCYAIVSISFVVVVKCVCLSVLLWRYAVAFYVVATATSTSSSFGTSHDLSSFSGVSLFS